MNTNAPTELPKNGNVDSWTDAQKAIVTAAGLTFTYPAWGKVPTELQGTTIPAPRAVVEHFLSVCAVTGLNPLAKQIYCIARYGRNGVEWSIQTAIDGFRVVAERSKQYDGQAPFEWMTKDQEWTDVFLPGIHGDHPLAARAKVYRKDWPADRPSVGIAEWKAYAQTKYDGSLTEMWSKQGAGQLAKCAEALAFRKAFPQDLSGVYTEDEMAGPAAAIAQDRADEIAPPYDWIADIAATDLDGLAALQERLEADGAAGPEEFSALLSRKASLLREQQEETIDAEVVDEGAATAPEAREAAAGGDETPAPAQRDAAEVPTPETGTERRTQDWPAVDATDWADDPDWKGGPCPVCHMRHDITDHDDDEFTKQQYNRQRAETNAMRLAAEQAAAQPKEPARAFNSSAMGKRS